MLKKLSLRFSAAAIMALLVIELLMLGLINGLNFSRALNQADEALDMLIKNDGKLPYHGKEDNTTRRERPPVSNDNEMPPPEDWESDREPGRMFNDKRTDTEQKFIIRYFYAKIDSSGEVTFLNTGHIATISSETAQKYALDVYKNGDERAFYNGMEFRYAVRKHSD
ncbi:MAG: hypothetical protein IIZ73_02305, partial [Ruminococcus sp.]|nr:hypothetical protein [Ruminococcus sp.]